MTYWTKILSLALGLLLLTPASAQTKGKDEKKKDNKFSYVQAVDIFGSSLALLDRHFVDSIDIKRLSRIGSRASTPIPNTIRRRIPTSSVS